MPTPAEITDRSQTRPASADLLLGEMAASVRWIQASLDRIERGSKDADDRLETRLASVLTEMHGLREQIAKLTGRVMTLETIPARQAKEPGKAKGPEKTKGVAGIIESIGQNSLLVIVLVLLLLLAGLIAPDLVKGIIDLFK